MGRVVKETREVAGRQSGGDTSPFPNHAIILCSNRQILYLLHGVSDTFFGVNICVALSTACWNSNKTVASSWLVDVQHGAAEHKCGFWDLPFISWAQPMFWFPWQLLYVLPYKDTHMQVWICVPTVLGLHNILFQHWHRNVCMCSSHFVACAMSSKAN